jgi:hypothetical protein
MGKYKADDGMLIWVVLQSFNWFGEEQLPVLMRVGCGLTELMNELHLNYGKYKDKPGEWIIAWRNERKGLDVIAKELQGNPALLKLFNYATGYFKSKLGCDIVNGGKNNPDCRGAVGAIITGEPLDSRDVKDSRSLDAKKVLLLQELEDRLDEVFQAIDAPVDQSEEPEGAKRGGKTKLPDDVFMSKIFPVLDIEFPRNGNNEGIVRRCEEIGRQYGVSGSTVKRKFYNRRYDMLNGEAINRGYMGL